MFEFLFALELQSRIGTSVQLTTSNQYFEGTILDASFSVVALESDDGYGVTRHYINIADINFLRISEV
ncbi:hypothetical protein DH09_19335 [Bacillaceae bacterium JMAK1]|nr:hypothetical protein DH09_19335 [Bacillaceae bacterium JMAK1]